MKKILRLFLIAFYICSILAIIIYQNNITTYIIENYLYKRQSSEYVTNTYSKKASYDYVKFYESPKIKSKDDIINIIYTILDSGSNEFTIYCDEEYENCQKDIEEISDNSDNLTVLNNFVHPYNSYNKLYISSNSLGKITISIVKLYNEEEIQYINTQISLIESAIIKDNMSTTDKIKAFHDYIINNTTYDEERANLIKEQVYDKNIFESHKASGVLKNHLALCSGYTDLMSIYLNKLNVINYKVSNTYHIWNAVNLNNEWLHLDLTWDDPVTSNGKEILLDDFFLIKDNVLKDMDTQQHLYNESIYNEIATSIN